MEYTLSVVSEEGRLYVSPSKYEHAPTPTQMFNFARRHLGHTRAVAIRYYKKFGGYCGVDLRKACKVQPQGYQHNFIAGIERLPKVFPSHAAADMYFVHTLAKASSNEDLSGVPN